MARRRARSSSPKTSAGSFSMMPTSKCASSPSAVRNRAASRVAAAAQSSVPSVFIVMLPEPSTRTTTCRLSTAKPNIRAVVAPGPAWGGRRAGSDPDRASCSQAAPASRHHRSHIVDWSPNPTPVRARSAAPQSAGQRAHDSSSAWRRQRTSAGAASQTCSVTAASRKAQRSPGPPSRKARSPSREKACVSSAASARNASARSRGSSASAAWPATTSAASAAPVRA